MFQKCLIVLLLGAQCLTVVVSLKIPSRSPGSSVNNGNAPSCPGCSVGKRDEDQIRIEITKKEILRQLHLSEAPKRRMLPTLPSLVKQMNILDTSQQNTEPDDDADDAVSRPLQFMVVGQRVKVQGNRSKSLQLSFSFNSQIYKSLIANVELWVHMKHKRANGKIRRLVVKDLDDPSQSTGRRFKPGEKGWQSFSVTPMVNKWVRKTNMKNQLGNANTNTHRIQIDCANCESAKKVIHYSSDKHKPILVINLDTSKSRRRKKRSVECVAGMKKCCLRPLYLNFTTHGWNKWIVTPLGFHVNYCTGACLGHGLPRTHHSSAIQVVSNQTITQCCSPSRLAGFSMLYFDDGDTIIKKDLLNLKVLGCKCA